MVAAIVLVAAALLWMIPPVHMVVALGIVLLFHGFGSAILALVVVLIVLGVRQTRGRPHVDGIARVPKIGPAPEPASPQPVKTTLQTMLGIVAAALALAGVVALVGWILAMPLFGVFAMLADSRPDLTPFFLIPVEATAALVAAGLLAYVGKLGAPKRQSAWNLSELALRSVGRILLLIVSSVISVFLILCMLTLARPDDWWTFVFGLGVVAAIGVWFLRRRTDGKSGFSLRNIGSIFLQTFLGWCAVLLAIVLTNHVWPYLQRWWW